MHIGPTWAIPVISIWRFQLRQEKNITSSDRLSSNPRYNMPRKSETNYYNRSAGLGRTRLFYPWAHEPEGGWSGSDVSLSHVVRPRQGSGFEGLGWVPLGPVRARQGPVWSRMGPHISRTSIRDSRAIRQGPSGPVGSYRVPTAFRQKPDLARRDPTGLDGSLDCPVSVHN